MKYLTLTCIPSPHATNATMHFRAPLALAAAALTGHAAAAFRDMELRDIYTNTFEGGNVTAENRRITCRLLSYVSLYLNCISLPLPLFRTPSSPFSLMPRCTPPTHLRQPHTSPCHFNPSPASLSGSYFTTSLQPRLPPLDLTPHHVTSTPTIIPHTTPRLTHTLYLHLHLPPLPSSSPFLFLLSLPPLPTLPSTPN